MRQESVGLYVHIPFCLQKCVYCDFNSVVFSEDLLSAYLTALRREIRTFKDLLADRNIISVFLGGGTPSLLPAETFKTLLELIQSSFGYPNSTEVTIEANPGTITPGYCRGLLSAGVNRLSIGVQSFEDTMLGILGRVHSGEQAISALYNAREAGFTNISIDLMFGLPDQSLREWKEELFKAVSLKPDHISIYALTVEEGTPLKNRVETKKLGLPGEESQRLMYETGVQILKEFGYNRYEISNFSLPGKECVHNLNYWNNGEYAGFGTGAFSFLNRTRGENEADISRYCRLITSNLSPLVFSETLSEERFIRETVILNLRRESGIDKKYFEKRFGIAIMDILKNEIEKLELLGLLISDCDSVRLTPEGILLSDSVFMEIVL